MTDEITLYSTYNHIHNILGLDGRAINSRLSNKIWDAAYQFCGEVADNVIKHIRFDYKAIVEVVKFDEDDFMVRFKVLDKQLKELVVANTFRGNHEDSKIQYYNYQEAAYNYSEWF